MADSHAVPAALAVRLERWRGNAHALNVKDLCHDGSDRQPLILKEHNEIKAKKEYEK